jgi:hypothetical protein
VEFRLISQGFFQIFYFGGVRYDELMCERSQAAGIKIFPGCQGAFDKEIVYRRFPHQGNQADVLLQVFQDFRALYLEEIKGKYPSPVPHRFHIFSGSEKVVICHDLGKFG